MTDVVSSFLKSPLGILTHRLATTSYDIPHCLSNRQEGGRPSGINIRKGKSAVLRSSQWSPDLSCSRSPFPVPGRAVQTLERNETVFWSVSFPYFFPIPCMYHKRGGGKKKSKTHSIGPFPINSPQFSPPAALSSFLNSTRNHFAFKPLLPSLTSTLPEMWAAFLLAWLDAGIPG